MYDKKTKFDYIAHPGCDYCGGAKGYIEIFNAYDPDFIKVEQCPSCLLKSSQKRPEKTFN